MTKTTKFLMMAASLLLSLIAQPSYSVAQDAPQLKEHQKSVALIDIRVDQMIKEAVAAGIQQEAIDQMELEGPLRGIKPSELARVFGAACLPENLNEVLAMTTGPPKDGLPFEFFLRIKFTATEPLERMQSRLAERSETITLDNGKEYLTPKGGESGLIFAHQVDKTTFEVGTKAYLMQSKRNFFTAGLKTAFASAPNESVRLVVDLETNRELLQQAAEIAKQELDPISSAYLDLIDNAKSLTITSSMGSENLLSLIAEANNDSDAEELAEGIDGLLGASKIAFGLMTAQMAPLATPEMQEPLGMVKGIVDSLAATQSETTVKLLVKKPEGFATAMAQLQQAAAAQAKKFTRLNEFRQLALAALNYESANMKFPFQNDTDSAISWRAKVLPYIELNTPMAQEIDLAKGAKDTPNSQFAKQMPEIYGPGGSNSAVSWIESTVNGFSDISDGSSNTIMLIENPKGGPWLEDNPLTIDAAVKLVTGLADGEELIVTFYDGSCSRISNRVPEKDLRNLFDPKDGNVIDDSWRQ